jgi:hypothetical protein
MKKYILFLAVAGMFLTFTAFVLSTPNLTGKKSTRPETTNSIPDDLKVIFKNSCMACHATGGKGRAMAKLNFSEWENYATDKQAKKAAAICKMISKGKMPPKSFRASHPEAIPTESQKDLIYKWSKSLDPEK